jgi:hypothetical protein
MDVVSAVGFRNAEIETEILLSRTTSEFSHSLRHKQPPRLVAAAAGLASIADATAQDR